MATVQQAGERHFLLTPIYTGPGAHLSSCTMGTISLSRGLRGRSVDLNTHLLAPRLTIEQDYACTPTPLPSACCSGNFTFYCSECCFVTNMCWYDFLVYPFNFRFPLTVTNILAPKQYCVFSVYTRTHARTCALRIFIID